jgi:hypothetical protein
MHLFGIINRRKEMSDTIPIDKQCQFHSETTNNGISDPVIYKCERLAVAVSDVGKRMCKMHRNHYDKRATKLRLPLSQAIGEKK